MEIAVIDWKNIDSKFVRDELLEDINAPQWVDFTAQDAEFDDESWFCRPECNHAKTVEDFYKATPPNSKKSASLFERLPFGDRNRSLRDASLKKRGLSRVSISPTDLKYDRIVEDGENKNHNLFTPPNYKAKSMKEAIKSSAENKTLDANSSKKEQQQPRSLRSTLSARNLFAGGDILSKVAEFFNELKKLAMRSKDRESPEEQVVKESLNNYSVNLGDEEKERKPLVEVSTEQCKAQQKSILQEKPRRIKRLDEAENNPITVDLKNIKRIDENLPIRTCPPTPQCFSASSKATPLKAFKSRTPPERRILNELLETTMDEKEEQRKEEGNLLGENAALIAEKEAKALDVLWFLKPCTLSS